MRTISLLGAKPGNYFLLVCLLLVGCGEAASDSNDYNALAKSIDEAVLGETESGFSGSIVIGRGNQIILEKAYGELNGYRFESNTRFWISSTGKQFVSASVMRAQEKGLLDIDDGLSEFFPQVPEDKKTITIRQLLTHMSGFSQSYVSEQVFSGDEAASAILAEAAAGRPGEGFRYSNSNFQLAAAIVEIVSGQGYQEFLRKEFLDPLGLENTGQAGSSQTAQVAPTRGELPIRLKIRYWGSQGMYSTASDLHKWARGLTTGKILSRESTEELFRPAATISVGFAAMGWFHSKTEAGIRLIFTRGNDSYGPNSLIYYYPDKDVLIVVLTHAGDKNADQSFSRAVHATIEKIIFEGAIEIRSATP